jgi:hypothetical protein
MRRNRLLRRSSLPVPSNVKYSLHLGQLAGYMRPLKLRKNAIPGTMIDAAYPHGFLFAANFADNLLHLMMLRENAECNTSSNQ